MYVAIPSDDIRGGAWGANSPSMRHFGSGVFVFILKGHTLLHEMPAFASAAAGRYVSTSV